MLLKNFGSLLAGTLGASTNIAGIIKTTRGKLATFSGVTYAKLATDAVDGDYYIENLQDSYNSTSTFPQNPYYAIILGDGDTPPTVDDYKLSGNLITTVRANTSSASEAFNVQCSSINVSVSGQISNTGTEPITIKEIALVQTTMIPRDLPMIMLTRDVLPEPIVLQAGEGKVFSIEIDTMSFVEQQVLQGDN